MDYLVGSKAYGAVALRLLNNGFNVNALRTNDTLRKDEWIQFDEAVVEVARERLTGIRDLIERGLTFNLKNALGTTVVEWENMSDMEPATLSMDPLTRGRGDRVEFDKQQLPIPIAHRDFYLGIRELEASRRLGEPLDTTQAREAARQVVELNESTLFNGAALQFSGAPIYGYTTHPERNTGSLSGDWANVATTGEEIVADVLEMITVAHDNLMFGPYVLYVPSNYWVKLQEDFKSNSDRTIKERIQAIDDIAAVRTSDKLTASNVILVQLSRNVVDLIMGLQPTTVSWETEGGMQINFKVMSIIVPRVKSDFGDRSGIVHYSN